MSSGSPANGHSTTRTPTLTPRRITAVASAALATALLVPIQTQISRPMLLAERFLPGSGWIELVVLVGYAAIVGWWMADPRRQPRVRRATWRLFSAVFFAQLALGLTGLERFLMSGELHLPVPAMILAGPLYRGHPSFMVFLFVGTLLLVGPAWCSHLCYLGSWDDGFAIRRRRPTPLRRWRFGVQAGVTGAVIAVALLLHHLGASPAIATGLGIGFGVVGVAIMLAFSKRTGAMTHCLTWCPIGLLAATVGKLSPFRIRIGSGCDGCEACTPACRYDALDARHLARRRPGFSCTLCGDCVGRCRDGQLSYRLPWLGPRISRAAFIAAAVALHTATLGVARI